MGDSLIDVLYTREVFLVVVNWMSFFFYPLLKKKITDIIIIIIMIIPNFFPV